MSTWQNEHMPRMTRAESTQRTRQRLLAEAQRLFRDRGYAATSLEQIAEAAEVTKGAIYGHFASKEDLMLSALEAAPPPDYSATLNDTSQPLRQRLAAFGRAAAHDPADTGELAMFLEFFAALLRAPDALQRYRNGRERRLQQLADTDDADNSDLATGVTPVQPWAIGQAMLVGLQIEKHLAPIWAMPGVDVRSVQDAFGVSRYGHGHEVATCAGRTGGDRYGRHLGLLPPPGARHPR